MGGGGGGGWVGGGGDGAGGREWGRGRAIGDSGGEETGEPFQMAPGRGTASGSVCRRGLDGSRSATVFPARRSLARPLAPACFRASIKKGASDCANQLSRVRSIVAPRLSELEMNMYLYLK